MPGRALPGKTAVAKLAQQHEVDYSWTPEKAEAVLRREWGDQYERKLDQAREVVSRYDGLLEHLDRSGLGNHPELIKLAARLGEKSGSAQARINQIMADKAHAYWGPPGPAKDAAIEEVSRLYREAYGG